MQDATNLGVYPTIQRVLSKGGGEKLLQRGLPVSDCDAYTHPTSRCIRKGFLSCSLLESSLDISLPGAVP